MNALSFEVVGIPKPQGSMKAFAVGGVARMKPSGGNDFAAWRNAVSDAARTAIGDRDPLDGPLHLSVAFRFPMPKSRGKSAHALGYIPKTTAPDLDKLVRSIGDALTAANVITDDARFASLTALKHEVTGWTGCVIGISELTP